MRCKPDKIKTARTGENLKAFAEGDYRFTKKGDSELFVFSLVKPTQDMLITTLASGGLLKKDIASIKMLGSEEEIKWTRDETGVHITLPTSMPGAFTAGFKLTLK